MNHIHHMNHMNTVVSSECVLEIDWNGYEDEEVQGGLEEVQGGLEDEPGADIRHLRS